MNIATYILLKVSQFEKKVTKILIGISGFGGLTFTHNFGLFFQRFSLHCNLLQPQVLTSFVMDFLSEVENEIHETLTTKSMPSLKWPLGLEATRAITHNLATDILNQEAQRDRCHLHSKVRSRGITFRI